MAAARCTLSGGCSALPPTACHARVMRAPGPSQPRTPVASGGKSSSVSARCGETRSPGARSGRQGNTRVASPGVNLSFQAMACAHECVRYGLCARKGGESPPQGGAGKPRNLCRAGACHTGLLPVPLRLASASAGGAPTSDPGRAGEQVGSTDSLTCNSAQSRVLRGKIGMVLGLKRLLLPKLVPLRKLLLYCLRGAESRGRAGE